MGSAPVDCFSQTGGAYLTPEKGSGRAGKERQKLRKIESFRRGDLSHRLKSPLLF